MEPFNETRPTSYVVLYAVRIDRTSARRAVVGAHSSIHFSTASGSISHGLGYSYVPSSIVTGRCVASVSNSFTRVTQGRHSGCPFTRGTNSGSNVVIALHAQQCARAYSLISPHSRTSMGVISVTTFPTRKGAISRPANIAICAAMSAGSHPRASMANPIETIWVALMPRAAVCRHSRPRTICRLRVSPSLLSPIGLAILRRPEDCALALSLGSAPRCLPRHEPLAPRIAPPGAPFAGRAGRIEYRRAGLACGPYGQRFEGVRARALRAAVLRHRADASQGLSPI